MLMNVSMSLRQNKEADFNKEQNYKLYNLINFIT